jgi:hypothetical protein
MVKTTADVVRALEIARSLTDAGIPVFAAQPCPSGPFGEIDAKGDRVAHCHRPGHGTGGVEYDLPAGWQKTTPATSKVWIDAWRPGWALAAVGGWAADFLDEDPRNGGEASVAELKDAGHWPTVFGVQETKSGGYHSVISPLRERKITGLLPGLDYQGGAADGQGRGFVWIAPTVGRSKDAAHVDPRTGLAVVRPYVWLQEPDLEWLADFGRDARGASLDPSVDGIRLRIAGWRAKRTEKMQKARERSRDGSPSRSRSFTPAQMDHFLAPSDAALRAAPIGEIEEKANAYACALSHFVPALLSEDAAFDRMTDALGETAYDPAHPASGWTADKFRAVIGDIGGRAPGDWHAVVGQEAPAEVPVALEQAVAAVDPSGDEVSALLAEMLTADDLASRQPPRHMIEGLLQFDSESWVIGEPGSRKSFVVLDMAAHVASGKPWQGRRVNQALVVFIVAEGAGGSAARIKAWQKTYGPMGQHIRFLPRPVQAARPAAWAVLVQACARLSAVAAESGQGLLVVLDTQARVTVGLKENDATDMGVFIDAVRAIREASGACVLTVHHTGRKGGDARGSSAIDGAQTTELKVVKDAGSAGGLYGRVIVEKQKDITEAEPVLLKFDVVDLGQDADGRAVDSLVVAPDGSWRKGEVDGATLDALNTETPFRARVAPQPWTHAVTARDAGLQRWLLQALADTAEDRGLTQSEWRGLVDEKLGRDKPTASAWRKAFQRVTSLDPKFAGEGGIIVKIHGADRWTVDRVALEALIKA